MNAVNLLPEKHRPRKRTAGKSGSALRRCSACSARAGRLLVYVLTLNSINSSKTQIAEAEAEAAEARGAGDSIGPYGNFAKVKQARVVDRAARPGRFDWERTCASSRVLPTGVWLVNA